MRPITSAMDSSDDQAMDFEAWIRSQLRDDPTESPAPARPPARPRIRLGTGALQAAGAVVALGLILAGLPRGEALPALQLGAVAPSHVDLPAGTWGGSPPRPSTENAPAQSQAGSESTAAPLSTATRVVTSQPSSEPDDRSGGAEPTPTGQPTPSTAPSGTPQTFTLTGGSATVSCAGGQPVLDSTAANPGYTVESGTQNGGSTLEVEFRSDSHDSRLFASCSSGHVVGQVEESSG